MQRCNLKDRSMAFEESLKAVRYVSLFLLVLADLTKIKRAAGVGQSKKC